MASSIIRFFKLASVCVCIVFFFHYFKYYGQNIFSRITVLYLIAKVEIMKLSHEIIKLKYEILVSERRKEKQNVSG